MAPSPRSAQLPAPMPEPGSGSFSIAPLPAPLTSLIGREREVDEVRALIDRQEARLITLIGPGGVGKTRLAIAVAHAARQDVTGGVAFVRLAAVADPHMVVRVVAQQLGVVLGHGQPLVEQLAGAIGNHHLLIVLDNYEHLLGEPPTWLVSLLERCPRAVALVTSRVVLNVSGEHRYEVTPLPAGGQAGDIAPAVALFEQRARAVRADFALDDRTREVVAEICQRLDGLPLAIELAAARVAVMNPDELLARLADRFTLLQGGQRDVPARLRSMRDAVRWSYDLLPEDQQWLFRQLAVLKGSFGWDAAEALGGETVDVMGGLTALVDCSLVSTVEGRTGRRFLLLETMREFGLELVQVAGEEHAAMERLATWCLAATRDLSPDTLDRTTWQVLDAIEDDIGHLRATLHWLEAAGRMEEVGALVRRMRWIWFLGGRDHEGVEWLQRVLAWEEVQGAQPIDLRVYLGQLGITTDNPAAVDILREAERLAEAAGDAFRLAEARFYLAGMERAVGNYAEARRIFTDLRATYARLAVPWRSVVVEYHLGVTAYGLGALDEADRLLEQSIRAADAMGNRIIPAMARGMRALIACERAAVDEAVALMLDRADEITRVGRADYGMLTSTAATVALASGRPRLAARLFGAASMAPIEYLLPEREPLERAEAAARQRLGEADFLREWAAGRQIPQADIISEILRLAMPEAADEPLGGATGVGSDLTPREQDVLRHLAEGRTNQQIADALFISRKTVMNHVASILSKLGVESRTAAASHAIRNGLV